MCTSPLVERRDPLGVGLRYDEVDCRVAITAHATDRRYTRPAARRYKSCKRLTMVMGRTLSMGESVPPRGQCVQVRRQVTRARIYELSVVSV
ncbi:TPA: hypothetical protein QCK54_004776 [Salmonella enterica subsp. enterica serovar Derby]|nr:hypothetical protein [Salmonella enterica subsp. enterica serovar Derby]